jgi:3-hydroxyisobutyrate dehydrogenase-like beta-hydroxyacid dehydrogenase
MSKSSEGTQVSVIGLGNMGSALAEALLAKGHGVTVWNRTTSKCEALAAAGAAVAASVAEAVAVAHVVLVCVIDHDASVALLQTDDVAGALHGKRLVQLSTVTEDQSRAMAEWANAKGASYLAGSILGLPQDVTGGSAIVVYSGPRDTFDDSREVFLALGGNPQHVGEDIGAAVTFDRVYYAFAYGMTQSFIQGAALAHAKGFSIEAYANIALARLPTFVWKLQVFADMIAARNHGGAQASLDVFKDSFVGTLQMCRDLGVDDSLPSAMMDNFARASAAGYGEQEISALFEVLIGDNR